MVDDEDWDEVKQVLDADISFDDPELKNLYDEIADYVQRAEVLEDHGEEYDSGDFGAESFRKLAYQRYESFVDAVQMKKDAEEYNF